MAPRATPLAAIHDALCDAFTLESLGRMLKLRLNRDLSDYSSRSDRQQVVFDLLDRAQREGFLDDLVSAARESNPGNEKLAVLPPTRGEELRYLSRLIEETEKKARLYSPLQSIAATGHAPLDAWGDDNLAPVTHQSRKREEKRESYDDVLAACGKVKRAALLGAPGSGKSTTLRKLAMDLARRAQASEAEPLPVLGTLGNWRGSESLDQFLKHTIGWDIQAVSRARPLVLLLDGLNEVPTATRTDKAKDVIRLQGSIDPGTDLYVSCRTEDYTGDLDLGLDTLTLEPLSPPRIQAALRQWVTNLGEAPGLGTPFSGNWPGTNGLRASSRDGPANTNSGLPRIFLGTNSTSITATTNCGVATSPIPGA
ncbi:MAG: NACHT domain-containing protein [Bryobacterales bacterium]|nr:NACHT domain-containing protein [Bryobacterales bacterium]